MYVIGNGWNMIREIGNGGGGLTTPGGMDHVQNVIIFGTSMKKKLMHYKQRENNC